MHPVERKLIIAMRQSLYIYELYEHNSGLSLLRTEVIGDTVTEVNVMNNIAALKMSTVYCHLATVYFVGGLH
jgi:hypothetical protein